MKKFILKIISFFILIICINIIYLFVIQKTDWNYKKRLEALNFKKPTFDLLVFGNSLTMDGVDTDYLTKHNYNSYNMSIGGATIKTSYIQLKEYLESYSYKPKYVIYGMGSYIDYGKIEQVHPIVEFTKKNKNYTIGDIPMLRFKWTFKELLRKIISKKHREAKIVKGQLRFEKLTIDQTKLNTKNQFSLKKYTESKYIKKLIDICNLNNIKLILVEMPGSKSVRHLKEFDCMVLDSKNQNGILFDFNTIDYGRSYDTKKYWISNHHLNAVGARKFTKDLISIIDMDVQQCN